MWILWERSCGLMSATQMVWSFTCSMIHKWVSLFAICISSIIFVHTRFPLPLLSYGIKEVFVWMFLWGSYLSGLVLKNYCNIIRYSCVFALWVLFHLYGEFTLYSCMVLWDCVWKCWGNSYLWKVCCSWSANVCSRVGSLSNVYVLLFWIMVWVCYKSMAAKILLHNERQLVAMMWMSWCVNVSFWDDQSLWLRINIVMSLGFLWWPF